jgi:hypothetical protein
MEANNTYVGLNPRKQPKKTHMEHYNPRVHILRFKEISSTSKVIIQG